MKQHQKAHIWKSSHFRPLKHLYLSYHCQNLLNNAIIFIFSSSCVNVLCQIDYFMEKLENTTDK